MKITLDLPEINLGDNDYGDPEYNPGICDGCGYERSNTMAKLVPFGWFHTDGNGEGHGEEPSCLQKQLDSLTQIGARAAWLVISQHVAKYPSRHSASTIRAVLTELMKPAWKVDQEAGR